MPAFSITSHPFGQTMQAPGTTRTAGFTLIELVTVLVIIGVLAVYALPRWAPADTTVAAQADRLARDLRHAQALAMNQGRTLSFDVQAPGGYRVADSGGTTITDPATQQALQVSLDNSVTLGGPDVYFDSLGRPVDNLGSPLLSDSDFSVDGPARTATVTLSMVTGFVTVSP